MGARITKRELLIFIVLLIIYCGTLFLKLQLSIQGWTTAYLADLIALPIILQISTWGIRKLKNLPEFKLSFAQIFVAFAYTSILFEGVLPYYNLSYTRDLIDVVMYAIGSLFFLLVQR